MFITSRMEARDGSFGFDFAGTYTAIDPHARLDFVMGVGDEAREVEVQFIEIDKNATEVIETFQSEDTHSIEMQKDGWQSILNRFKAHVESSAP